MRYDTRAEIGNAGRVWWAGLLVFGVEKDGFAFKLSGSRVSDGNGTVVSDGDGGDIFSWVGRYVARGEGESCGSIGGDSDLSGACEGNAFRYSGAQGVVLVSMRPAGGLPLLWQWTLQKRKRKCAENGNNSHNDLW